MYIGNDAAKQQAAYGYGTGAAMSAGSLSGVIGEPVNRIPELPAALDNMERAADFLHNSVNDLVARLEGLVRPAATETNGQGVGLAPPSSGYASTIHGQAARVTMQVDRIQDLLRRLEV